MDYKKYLDTRIKETESTLNSRKKATSNWDKNWLRAKISVQTGAFGGTYDADLTTSDFENFKNDLNSLYENLNSEIKFEDLEAIF